ncbi:hypothetical protein CCP3SC15_2920001 [Gammaproteobacteria bacterium]
MLTPFKKLYNKFKRKSSSKIKIKRQITWKELFIIENVLLIIVLGGFVSYEIYSLKKAEVSLTTQNEISATSVLMSLLAFLL